MDTSNLTDALMGDSGGDSSDSSTFATTPPMAPPGGASPNVPAPQNTDVGAAPDIGAQLAAGQPIATNTPGPAKPAGTPSVWKDIVMGALTGLAGSTGQTHFGGGLGAGSAAVLQQKQREIENAQRASQIQFESARAADSHILAMKQAQEADLAIQEHKNKLADYSANVDAYLKDNGLAPVVTITSDNNQDSHAQAVAGLSTLAAANGGKIPVVATTNSPIGAGADKKNEIINAYAATPAQVQNLATDPRTKTVPKIVNDVRAAQGQLPMTDEAWGQLGATPELADPSKGLEARAARQLAQKKIIEDALLFVTAPQIAGGDTAEQVAGKNGPVINSAAQQLATYKNNPNADPAFTALLQNRLDTVKSAVNDSGQRANAAKVSTINATAVPEAQAAAKKSAAEQAAKNASNSVYGVVTDANGVEHTQMMTSEQAQQAGATAIRPVKQADISKDQHDIKVLNDIQVKSNVVQRTATALDGKSLSDVAGISRYLADNPNTAFSSLANAAVFSNASPQAQAYIIAINSLRESSMGLQKVLTGTARTNETQLHALLNTLPGYEPNSRLAIQKIAAFNQNLSMLAEGLPENTGVRLLVPRGQGQSQPITVTDPNGTVHTFPDQQSADKFKKLAGIR